MSQFSESPPRLNGPGLASVIVGGLGVLTSVPIVAVLIALIAVLAGGLQLSDSSQVDVVVGLLSWFLAVPLTALFALAGTVTAVVGLFRRPRVLPAVGLTLSLFGLLAVAAALTLGLLVGNTLDAIDPLLGPAQ
jgi:hypothetical protein